MTNPKRPEGVTRQLILQYIKLFIEGEGYPPSIRDIGEGVGLESTSSVHMHLVNLEEEGKIERRGRDKRWIIVKNG